MAPKKRSPQPINRRSSPHQQLSGPADPEEPSSTTQSQSRRRKPRARRPSPDRASSPDTLAIRQQPHPSTSLPTASVKHEPLTLDTDLPGSSSRRQSVSTMRTSSLPYEGPSTSTPTGRVSKAKKGKRVHACELPGCGKVCMHCCDSVIWTRQPALSTMCLTQSRSLLVRNIAEDTN